MNEDKSSNSLVTTFKAMDWNLKATEEDIGRYRKMIEILESRKDWLSEIVGDIIITEVR